MHLIPTIQMLSLNRVHSIKPLSTTANNCLIWDRNNVGSRATAGIKRWPCKEVTDDWSEVVSRAQVTIQGTNSRKWWRPSLAIWWKESVVCSFGNASQNKWSPPCIKIANTVIPIHFFNAGVLQERYITSVLNDAYFSSITEDMNTTWKNKNGGKSVKETFDEYIVKYMGEPMKELLRYNSCWGILSLYTGLFWAMVLKRVYPLLLILEQGTKIWETLLLYIGLHWVMPLDRVYPLLSILEQGINIWKTLLLYIGLYWVIPPVPWPPNSRTGYENLAKGVS